MPRIVSVFVRSMSSKASHFMFGPHKIDLSELFFVSKLSVAFVNHKPIVPGHVLVASKRRLARLGELTDEEICDLWKTAKIIGNKIETLYGGESLTYVIQDGQFAGQTVAHVHIHILPRKKKDFENNDEVYDQLEMHDQKRIDGTKERKPRIKVEMADEAAMLRTHFPESESPDLNACDVV